MKKMLVLLAAVFLGCWANAGELEEALHKAVIRGDVVEVRKYILKKADVNAVDEDGDTTLHNAARKGHIQIVKDLLAAKANVKAVNKDGNTALSLAVLAEHPQQVVKALLDAGSDPNAVLYLKDKDQGDIELPVLSAASQIGDIDMIKALLAAKVNVNAVNKDGITALHEAAFKGHIEAVKLLLAAGANVKAVNKQGNTALSLAIANPQAVKALLEAGADPNAVLHLKDPEKGDIEISILALAVSVGNVDVIKALLAAGADVEKEGEFLISFASKAGNHQVVKVLREAMPLSWWDAVYQGDVSQVRKYISKKIDVDKTVTYGFTALHLASTRGHTQIVKDLLAAGANVKAVNEDGNTALSLAVANKHPQAVKALLEAGADPNAVLYIKDKDKGDTELPVLSVASRIGDIDMIKALLAAKVNVNAVSKNGFTALSDATSRGHIEAVKLLLAAGANVNAVDKDGFTALHEAAFKGHIEAVKLLLAAGANVNATAKNGMSVLFAAALGGNVDVVKTLLDAGADIKKYGKSSIAAASKKGHTAVVEVLEAAGAQARP